MTAAADSVRVVRDPDEEHRTATSLELLFDLCFVVAIAQGSAALHHELVAGHVADGIVGFILGFFAIWWAWMNFTWFASAHDSGDIPFRLLTLVQMAGALVLAAGIGAAVEGDGFLVVTIGYLIMRIGIVASWWRVGRLHPPMAARARRYAGAIAAIQVLWLARLGLGEDLALTSFIVLAAGELLVPVWAERAGDGPHFHAEHIEERYGLFTIIVLGESILSATVGLQVAVSSGGLSVELVAIGVGALLAAFSAWWIYFDHPGHLAPTPAQAFRWGYGHVVVFASLAALGAGVYVAAEAASGHADERIGALAVAIPAAGYLGGLALIMVVTGWSVRDVAVTSKLGGAGAILAIGLVAPVAPAVVGVGLVLSALAAAMALAGPRRALEAEATVADRADGGADERR